MSGSYTFPPMEATTGTPYYTPQHSRDNSYASVHHLSPNKKAGSNGYMNGGSNAHSQGSSYHVRKAGSNHALHNSLHTLSEVSNETTPVVSPSEEVNRSLDVNSLAHVANGHVHSHSHSHNHHHHDHHDHHHDHHSHAHSHSLPLPMKGRPRGESDLGRPLQTYHPALAPASKSWFSLPEALTSLLIPLPYLLLSAAYGTSSALEEDGLPPLSAYARLQKSVLGEGQAGTEGLVRRGNSLVEACTLTSGTFLLVGIIAKMRSSERMLDRRKDKVEATPGLDGLLTPASVQKMVVRSLGVGLPYYAATQIGGMRTGIVLLIAMASGLANTDAMPRATLHDWKHILSSRLGSLAVIVLAMLLDFSGITFKASFSDLLFGYLALACSIFLISPPLPTLGSGVTSQPSSAITPTTPVSFRNPWKQYASSPLVSSVSDVNITLAAGALSLASTILVSGLLSTSPPVSVSAVAFSTLAIASSTAAILFAQPSALRSQYRAGVGFSCFLFATFAFLFSPSLWPGTILNGGLSALSFIGVLYDTSTITAHQHHDTHVHEHAHNAHTHHRHDGNGSAITRYFMDQCEPGSLIYGILSEKDSRRIAYFTCLNFAFMIVQGIYGYLSGSLGLLSDTVHMFFDCLGLVVGLGAAVASKWPTSPEMPYGWGKLNTLAGFGNGIFLMLVSIEFVWEAMEGIVEQKELRHVQELLVVSTLGFLVNMVGLFAFGHAHAGHDHGHGHGHGHSHGNSHDHSHSHAQDHSQSHSHSHGHSHDQYHNHSHSHAHARNTSVTSVHSHKSSNGTNGDIHGYCDHTHDKAAHSHEHGHDHHNDNMHGIFLHVAADAGGSAAVIISTALTLWKPWYLWDPLATIIIAILIFAAAVPLVVSSGQKLLLVIPDQLEYSIKNTLQELGEMRGVVGYAVPRFWIDDKEDADSHGHHHHGHDHGGGGGSSKVQGVIHVIANPAADVDDVRHRVDEFLRDRQMNCVVHVEREGDHSCWCGGGPGSR